jgi:cell division protein FtsI/penicillin-binding protein 2
MINKRGGIVAIEPKNREILALVTAPSYDPSGREDNALKLYLIIPRFDSKTAIRPRTFEYLQDLLLKSLLVL